MTSNKKTKWVVGIFEYLTIIFIVLKLTGTIDWNWDERLLGLYSSRKKSWSISVLLTQPI